MTKITFLCLNQIVTQKAIYGNSALLIFYEIIELNNNINSKYMAMVIEIKG